MRRRREGPPGRENAIVSVGPLPPAGGVVGEVHAAFTDALADGVSGLEVRSRWPLDEGDIMTLKHRWKLGIFHLGATVDEAQAVYRASWRFRGLLVLHAFAIEDVIRSLAQVDEPVSWATGRELSASRAGARRHHGVPFTPSPTPAAVAIVRRALRVAVFSDAARTALDVIGSRTPVAVIAPPVIDDGAVIRSAVEVGAEIRTGAAGGERLVVIPSDRAAPDDVERALRAVATLPADVHVALVGVTDVWRDARALDVAAALGTRVRLHLRLSTDELLARLAAADLVVDLRRPHHVAVSVGVVRSLQVGAAVVVAEDAITPGAPTGAAALVSPAADPHEVARVIEGLLDDPARRRTMGAEASAFAEGLRRAAPDAFRSAVADTLTMANDATIPAMDRWGVALADLGVDDEHLDAGYFVRYARSLTSFAGTSQPASGAAETTLLDSP